MMLQSALMGRNMQPGTGIPICGECEVCDPTDGSCYHVPAGTPCDDRDSRRVGDACTAGGECVGTPCSECQKCESGACVNDDGATCSDGDLCTTGDQCLGGTCIPGTGSPICGECGVCDPTDGSCDPAKTVRLALTE